MYMSADVWHFMFSGRFNLLKRKKPGSEPSKGKKAVNGNGVSPESSLMSSCSVPPNVKFGLRGSSLGEPSSSLTQSQPLLGKERSLVGGWGQYGLLVQCLCVENSREELKRYYGGATPQPFLLFHTVLVQH